MPGVSKIAGTSLDLGAELGRETLVRRSKRGVSLLRLGVPGIEIGRPGSGGRVLGMVRGVAATSAGSKPSYS